MRISPLRFPALAFTVTCALLLFVFGVIAQQEKQKPGTTDDTIKIDVDLVNVPLIASDRNDVYVADLQKEDFTLLEDGVKQEITFFGAVREPFHVVLMLDTSGSTREKLGKIQDAAKAFVAQLQVADRVKIVSFDDQVKDWGEFTGDRNKLRGLIDFLSPGQGTKLYDATKLALNSLRRVQGRKAIVLFTDGVDWHSDATKFDDNLKQIEESGVIVYPIRYDTRIETEALVREQQRAGESVDLGSIFGGGTGRGGIPDGRTPTTVPGGGGGAPGGNRPTDTWRLPIPPIIVGGGGGRYPDSRYPGGGGGRYPDNRYPDDNRYPGGGGRYPDDRYPDSRYPDDRNRYPDSRYPDDRNRYPDNRYPDGRTRNPNDRRYPDDPTTRPGGGGYPDTRRNDPRANDSIGNMLDGLYRIADQYLDEVALKSGGKLHRADTLRSLPDAFANIAAELRNQYSLGYYPTNAARDGKYRKIQIKVARPNVVLRARPGYRAPDGKEGSAPKR